jgi:hypothetical protein
MDEKKESKMDPRQEFLSNAVMAGFETTLGKLQSANIYKNGPIYIPEPLVIEKNQRPYPIP